MENNILNKEIMKFTIEENGNLTIVDDKKTLILNTDKFDLIALKESIENYICKDEKKVSSTYKYNPRSKRLELCTEQ